MAASPGPLPGCLPDPSCVTLNDVFWQGGIMMMIVSATTVGGVCPRCGVHSSQLCRVDIAGRCAIFLATVRWSESVWGRIVFIVG